MSAEVLAPAFLTRTRLRVLDESLARLGQASARLRLRVGELLELLVVSGGVRELGMSSFGAYANERCERGKRWAADSRAVARRLSSKADRGLSLMRRELIEGRMLWSMAELLSPHATPEDEEMLVALAKGRTVRAMRGLLARRKGVEPEQVSSLGDDDDTQVMRVGAGLSEVRIYEVTRRLVERVDGTLASDEDVFDAMLGEGQSSLIALERSLGIAPADDTEEEERRLRLRALAREEARLLEERAECSIPAVRPLGEVEVDLDAPVGRTARELDAEIRRCLWLLARRDLEMGRLWLVLNAHQGWRSLGYANAGQYARERIGVSKSSLSHRGTLARYVAALPALGAALQDAKIGYEAALLVGRVATASTIDAWLARAMKRTVKHLREEVASIDLRAKLGEAGPFAPPSDGDLATYFEFERAALTGEIAHGVLEAKPDRRQISVRAGSGQVLRLRVRPDQLAEYHRLRKRFERVAPRSSSLFAYLCLSVWEAWTPTVRQVISRWDDVHRRDCYRCASPVCTRRDITAHHLLFRSHGGGDAAWNIITLCSECHLEGVHGGTLRASPPASRVRWEIGRYPIMIVVGRDRRLLDDAI